MSYINSSGLKAGLVKNATKQGAEFLEDKTVKIVEVFQGLCTGVASGLQYDSNEARAMNSGSNVVFQVPCASMSSSSSSSSFEEYVLTAEGIFPSKCMMSKDLPLPRIVSQDQYDPRALIGFSLNMHRANTLLQGDRQGPRLLFARGESQESVNTCHQKHRSKSMCDEKGKIKSLDRHLGLDPAIRLMLEQAYWNETNVASASPP